MKTALRSKISEKRNSLSGEQINKKSFKIMETLFSLDEFRKAKVIHCYISKEKEVQTGDIIKESSKNKTVVVPCVQKEGLISAELNDFCELKKNSFGVLEPADPHPFPAGKIELALVPGIVFDRKGYRIGYGKGYYDKFLRNFRAIKIGLAYDFQVVDEVPKEEHDIKVDYIITEKEVIGCKDD